MSLRQQINDDLKTAMRNKDKDSMDILRVVKGEIARNESPSSPMSDVEITKIIAKLVKNLKQVNDTKSKNEMDFLKNYLPKPLTEDEIKEIINDICLNFQEPLTMKDMGKIMSNFNVEYNGKADNKMVASIIKNKINV